MAVDGAFKKDWANDRVVADEYSKDNPFESVVGFVVHKITWWVVPVGIAACVLTRHCAIHVEIRLIHYACFCQGPLWHLKKPTTKSQTSCRIAGL